MNQNQNRQIKQEQHNNASVPSTECTVQSSTIATDNGNGTSDINELQLTINTLEHKLNLIESEQKLAKVVNEKKWQKSEIQGKKMGEDMAKLMVEHQKQMQEMKKKTEENLIVCHQRQVQELNNMKVVMANLMVDHQRLAQGLKEMKEKNELLEGTLKDFRLEKQEMMLKFGHFEANFAKISALLECQQKNNMDKQMDLDLTHQEQMGEEENGNGNGGEGREGEREAEFDGEAEGGEGEEIGDEEEAEEEQKGGNDDEDEEPIEQEQEADELMEIEIIKEVENAQQPAPTITREVNIKGKGQQIKEYHFLKTVRSLQELHNIRFKNYCTYSNGKQLDISKPLIIPCTAKYKKQCDFELLALLSTDLKSIHVYAHSEHNHPVMPEEKRALHKVKKELLPHENPPQIYRTVDYIEWTFLQTFPDYEQMKKFCIENKCQSRAQQVRYHCNRKKSHDCKFMLLKLKTTQQGYHVYKHGEHNGHPNYKQKIRMPKVSKI